MYQLKVKGIKLPKLYVAQNKIDIQMCKSNGLPYIVWRGDQEKLLAYVFLPVLKKMYPYIKWNEVLHISGRANTIVYVPGTEEGEVIDQGGIDEVDEDSGISDIATSERVFAGQEAGAECELDEYLGDFSSYVDVEKLAELKLLPHFMDDIQSNIRQNLIDQMWTEGYDKKRRAPLGRFTSHDSRNLMIIDISCSIPRGISATMITLAETLRSYCNCDLIFTAAKTIYYERGSELPSPGEIRKLCPLGQESTQFNDIIINKLRGRTYDNVICFGDYDTPDYEWHVLEEAYRTIKVHKIWNYHTYRENTRAGYTIGFERYSKPDEIVYDIEWARIMKD
jgi:hypothetical protein